MLNKMFTVHIVTCYCSSERSSSKMHNFLMKLRLFIELSLRDNHNKWPNIGFGEAPSLKPCPNLLLIIMSKTSLIFHNLRGTVPIFKWRNKIPVNLPSPAVAWHTAGWVGCLESCLAGRTSSRVCNTSGSSTPFLPCHVA